jgi:hypothetical protein
MGFGDYNYFKKQFADKTITRYILATDTSTELDNLITPKSANHQLYIQKITFYETTESNGKSLAFQDDSSTVKGLGKYSSVTAAAGVPKSFVGDYGPEGAPLGVGKNFDVIVSAAGIAGVLHVEAYERLGATVAIATTN